MTQNSGSCSKSSHELFQTIRFPFYYRTKNHRRDAAIAIVFGLAVALANAAQPFVMGYAKRRIGCPAAGCFANDWAFSNTVSESSNAVNTGRLLGVKLSDVHRDDRVGTKFGQNCGFFGFRISCNAGKHSHFPASQVPE